MIFVICRCCGLYFIFADDINFWHKASIGEPVDYSSVFKGFKAVTDTPAAAVWFDLTKQYPNAKVILSVRSPESWYESCVKTIFHVQYDSPYYSFLRRVVSFIDDYYYRLDQMLHVNWGYMFGGDYSRENTLRIFDTWNKGVIAKCPKEKLLVFDVKQGWEPLCKFLGKNIPDTPFPNANDAAEFKKDLEFVAWFGGDLVKSLKLGATFGFLIGAIVTLFGGTIFRSYFLNYFN